MSSTCTSFDDELIFTFPLTDEMLTAPAPVAVKLVVPVAVTVIFPPIPVIEQLT
jgi:hypothetical protein